MADDQAAASPDTRETVEHALGDMINAFAVDDYQLSVTSFDQGMLRLAIEAGPSACAECLVPEKMLASLIRNTLPPDIAISGIAIRYPAMAKQDDHASASQEDANMDEWVGGVGEFRHLSLFSGQKDVADGIPALPVSTQHLARAVAASGRSGDAEIGRFPGHDAFTVRELARVAILAGCREDALPLLITAFEIMADPRFPVALFTESRGSFFPYLVVNGPIRHQLGINCRSNVFGPGFRANATIGRAVRLGLSRFAGAKMDSEGPSALGTGFRFTCVVGEDEENSPWPPLHTQFGLGPQDSSVMVLAALQPGHVTHQLSVKPEELSRAFADELNVSPRFQGFDVALPSDGYAPKAILVIGEDHRGYFRDAGWDRERLQAALHEATGREPEAIHASGYRLDWPQKPALRADGTVSPFSGPQDFLIVPAGSGGGRSMIGSAVYGELRAIALPQGTDMAAATAAPSTQGAPSTIDDYVGLVAKYMDGGATDGWPIIPPDAEGVGALIAASGRSGDDEIGSAPWRPNAITMRDVAISAYMAGCGPELMPLLTPVFETLFSGEGKPGLGGMASSTGGYNCWLVVHGPIAQQLGIKGGSGLFGPSAYANVAIGRAIRLAMMNLAGLKPNLADRSCVGQAYKYGVVFADDEQTSWGRLDLGADLTEGESGFTLLWGFHTRLIMNEEATTPEQLLRSIAEGMTTVQNFDSPAGRAPGEEKSTASSEVWIQSLNARSMYTVMSQGHRAILEQAGWGRGKVQEFLAEHCVRTIGELRRTGLGTSPFFEHHQGDDELVSLVTAPHKIVPIAAGGPGGATVCFSSPLALSRRLAT